jgi:hypothetical protein
MPAGNHDGKEKVIAQIERAFGDVDAAGVQTVGDLLREDQGWDEAVGKEFRGRWQDLPREWLSRYSLLTFAEAESLQFYLPAMMCWVVADANAVSTTEGDNLIVHLLRLAREFEANRGKGAEFIRTLSPEKRRAIVAFLTFLAWRVPRLQATNLGNALAIWKRVAG